MLFLVGKLHKDIQKEWKNGSMKYFVVLKSVKLMFHLVVMVLLFHFEQEVMVEIHHKWEIQVMIKVLKVEVAIYVGKEISIFHIMNLNGLSSFEELERGVFWENPSVAGNELCFGQYAGHVFAGRRPLAAFYIAVFLFWLK